MASNDIWYEEMQIMFEYGCNPIIIERVIAIDLENFLNMSFRSLSH
jgi:hypothetical protein